MSAHPETWIRTLPATVPAPLRLLCFPHAGASASAYRELSAALSPACEVLAVQYPGRQDRYTEPPLESVHELADAITAAVAQDPSDRLALFGHSMGAAVAFEVARRLERRRGPGPVHLFASAMRPPAQRPRRPLARLSDAELLATLGTAGGTDDRVLGDRDLLELVLPALRGDYVALNGYAAAASDTVEAPISVLVGDDDAMVTVEEARAWRRHTTGRFSLTVLEAGHFYLDSQAKHVAGIVRRELGRP